MSASDPILARLLELHPKKIDLSLDRMHRLLVAMGDPQARLPPVIHVAGTNGKGSTIAFMRAILEAAGLRVHVYTSPHLVRFNERIRLAESSGGKLVADAALAAAVSAVEAANGSSPITFFEATTAAAFKLFSEHPADVLLLEVGLGGRLDATNVIDSPACAVITPISRDHVEFLGDSMESIAKEKAGILKRGTPAIFSQQYELPLAVLERAAARLDIGPKIHGRDYLCQSNADGLMYEDERGVLNLPSPRLVGAHQTTNAGAAIAAVRATFPNLSIKAYRDGLPAANWPARLQNLAGGRLARLAPEGAELWLDGGHNEAGASVLAQAMAAMNVATPRPLVLVVSALKSKDVEGFFNHFAGLASQAIAIPIQAEQASWPPEGLARIARNLGLDARPDTDVAHALQNLATFTWRIAPRILIAGSLYLCGHALTANETLPT